METKNKSFRVTLRVIETWAYTLIGMSGLLIVSLGLLFLSRRYLGPRGLLIVTAVGYRPAKAIWFTLLFRYGFMRWPDGTPTDGSRQSSVTRGAS